MDYVKKIVQVLEEALAEARAEAYGRARAEIFDTLQTIRPGKQKRSAAFNEARDSLRKVRRSADDIENTIKALATYIKKHPDQRIEQIAVGMNMQTKDLVRPMKKLLEDKIASRKGQRRATTYKIKE